MTNYNQSVRDAQNAMQARYDEVESWISTIEADTAEIERLTPQLTKKEGWWIFKSTKVDVNVERQIMELNAEIDEVNAKIAAAYPTNSSFTELTSSIDDCVDAVNNADWNVNGKNDVSDAKLMMTDLKVITNVLKDLVDALKQQVVVQTDVDMMSVLQQNGGSSADRIALAQKSITDQNVQAQILNDLNHYLKTTNKSFNKDYQNADADLNSIHWWDYAFGFGTDERKARDEAIKENSVEMMTFSLELQDNLKPLLVSNNTTFALIAVMLDEIIKKIAKILNSNLSPAEKTQSIKELNNEIMAIFVQVVNLLTLVQQDSAKAKATSDAQMAEATNESSAIGFDNAQAEWKKILQNIAYAAVMGILMEVVKYTLMVVGTLAMPSIGSVLVGMLLIALEASGALDMLTEQAAKSMGDLGAQLFVAGLEILVSVGGAAVADKIAQQVMRVISTQIAAMVATKTGQTVVAKVAQVVDEATAKMVAQVVEETIKNSAERAANKVFVTYFEKNGIELIVELIKETITSKGVMSGVERMVYEPMKEAAEEAAKMAAANVEEIVLIAGKDATADATQILSSLKSVPAAVADTAAAKAMQTSLDDMAKVSLNETRQEVAATTGKRVLASTTYAIASNNILVGTAEALSKDEDDENSWLYMTLEILQALLMIVSQLGGSGVASQWMKDTQTTGRVFNQAASGLTLTATGVQTVGSGTEYGIQMKQADATEAMMKIQAVLDILIQAMSPMIQARKDGQGQHDSELLTQMIKSNRRLASTLSSYLDTSARVLLA